MFGYIRPRVDQLKVCDHERYKAAYCGLCKTLGKKFGFFSRFFVNYDSVFLYFLLHCAGPEEKTEKCFCPSRPFCRKKCYPVSDCFEEVAAKTVILCTHKLDDAIHDDGFFKRAACRFAKLLTHRAYGKAVKQCPSFDGIVRLQLEKLRNLEETGCDSLDSAAEPFALLLAGCADGIRDAAVRRAMEQLLFHTGRFVYLTDALDDLPDDIKKKRYNVLARRFSLQDGKLTPADSKYFSEILDVSVSLAGAALELLPCGFGTPVAENIVYLGMPAVAKTVAAGSFKAGMRL